MKKITVSLAILLGATSCDGYSMSLQKEMEVASKVLEGQPVLVKDTENVIGVITDSTENFPKSDSDITQTNKDINCLTDFSLGESERDKTNYATAISLNGKLTSVVLADFQRKVLETLRNGGIRPVAIFEPERVTVVTPDGSEKKLKVNIARWKIH